MPIPLPPLNELTQVLTYDPETGTFRNRIRRSNNAKEGEEAGCVSRGRVTYRVIRYQNRLWLAHRLAWLFITGDDPGDMEIDHINGDGLDNCASNLRLATHQQNLRNQRRKRNNTSGYRGVSLNDGAWQASIKVDGKTVTVGRSKTKEVAARMYQEAAKKHYGEFARF